MNITLAVEFINREVARAVKNTEFDTKNESREVHEMKWYKLKDLVCLLAPEILKNRNNLWAVILIFEGSYYLLAMAALLVYFEHTCFVSLQDLTSVKAPLTGIDPSSME